MLLAGGESGQPGPSKQYEWEMAAVDPLSIRKHTAAQHHYHEKTKPKNTLRKQNNKEKNYHKSRKCIKAEQLFHCPLTEAQTIKYQYSIREKKNFARPTNRIF